MGKLEGYWEKGSTTEKIASGFNPLIVGLNIEVITDSHQRIDRVILSDRFKCWAGIRLTALRWFL